MNAADDDVGLSGQPPQQCLPAGLEDDRHRRVELFCQLLQTCDGLGLNLRGHGARAEGARGYALERQCRRRVQEQIALFAPEGFTDFGLVVVDDLVLPLGEFQVLHNL